MKKMKRLGILALTVSMGGCGTTKFGVTKEDYRDAVKKRIDGRNYVIWGQKRNPEGLSKKGLEDVRGGLSFHVKGDSLYSDLLLETDVDGKRVEGVKQVSGRMEHYSARELSRGRLEVMFSIAPREAHGGSVLPDRLVYRFVFGPWDAVAIHVNDDYFKGYWDWNRWEETAKDSPGEDFMQNWLARGEELQKLITGEERAFVRQEADRQNTCRDTFVDLYQSWRERWLISPTGEKLPEVVIDWEGRKVWLNSPGEGASRRLVDPRSLPEFSRLVGMGEKVIPFVMELMMDNPDENFVLLLLYEELSKSDFMRVTGFMSEPMRAVKTVKAWVAGKK